MVLWSQARSVLLVTSHPDDESMFFAPTIQRLVATVPEVHVLCLSTAGNAEGLGHVRSDELVAACGVLGVPRKNLTIVDHELLQDGMHARWEASVIRALTLNEIKLRSANVVLTFDGYGVSGHPNHRSTHRAVMELFAEGSVESGVELWTLESTNLIRKFSGPFDIAVSLLGALVDDASKVILSPNFLTSWRAMAKHWSQFVWYRVIFLAFSRYAYVNTLRKVR
ncbi:hypothetical protein BSKO_07422 [Bryopsis sp. KO-2023]|nr:hypothetical protein BSKO_07422 [Bryopsis sp. KO-2023]